MSAVNARGPRGTRQPDSGAGCDRRRALGRLGEEIAAAHVQRRGFAIVARNARTRHGEIDLIAFDGVVLAFVEVKTLRAAVAPDGSRVRPLDGLRVHQRLRLRRLARSWLSEQQSPRAREVRFDAIGVLVDASGCLLELEHLEGAW